MSLKLTSQNLISPRETEVVLLDADGTRITLSDIYPDLKSFQKLGLSITEDIFNFPPAARASRPRLHMLLNDIETAVRKGDNPVNCICQAIPISLIVQAEQALAMNPEQAPNIKSWKEFDLAIILLSQLITVINEGKGNALTRDMFAYLRYWVSSMASVFLKRGEQRLAFPDMPQHLSENDQWLRINDLLTVIYSFDPETGGTVTNVSQVKGPLKTHALVLEAILGLPVGEASNLYPMRRLMSALATYTYIYAESANHHSPYSFPLAINKRSSEMFRGGYLLSLTESLREYLLLAQYGEETLRNDFFGNAIETIKNIKATMPRLTLSTETLTEIDNTLSQCAFIAICGGYGTQRYYRPSKYTNIFFAARSLLNNASATLNPLIEYHDKLMQESLVTKRLADVNEERLETLLSNVPGICRLAIRSLLSEQRKVAASGKWNKFSTAEIPAVNLA